MILESMKNTTRVEKLHPSFKIAFDYIKSNDLMSMSPCKIELDGKNLFIIVSEGVGKTENEVITESHNKYIDIQIPIVGTEIMGWIPRSKLSEASYNSDKDLTLYDDKPTNYITVSEGNFVIFFPEDGHAPGIGEGAIKKIIVKVAQ
ncbi:MAG: YhcH/YjgK/YiaL family protein [Bacteroidales bacterium]|nr:YhcH/YjgK/YiaL family protein [Bacteroidales bacterium]